MRKNLLLLLFTLCYCGMFTGLNAAVSYALVETEYQTNQSNSSEFLELEIDRESEYAYVDYSQRIPFVDVVVETQDDWEEFPDPEWEDTPIGSELFALFLFLGLYFVFKKKKIITT